MHDHIIFAAKRGDITVLANGEYSIIVMVVRGRAAVKSALCGIGDDKHASHEEKRDVSAIAATVVGSVLLAWTALYMFWFLWA